MAKQTAADKIRKKKWFAVIAPKLFKERVIGEIPLYESSSMLKRTLTVNMMNLTGDPKSQHMNVRVRINDVKDGKGFTEILGYEVMPTSVKRLVRRDKTKVDDSVVVITSDKKNVRIKPLLVTNSVVDASVATSIRTKVRNSLARFVARIPYDKLVEEIMSYKLQKYIGGLASKITPIRNCEIRAFQLVEREDVAVYKPTKEEEIKKEEEIPEEEEKQETSKPKLAVPEKLGFSEKKEEQQEAKEKAEEEGEGGSEETEEITDNVSEEASEEENQ